MSVDAVYEDVAEQQLENLREEVGSRKVELQKMKIITR